MNHVDKTIATYDSIAEDYNVISTPENRAWLEDSMQIFASFMSGKDVLVAGCGEGKDSRFLRDLGFSITSFDLSDGMLTIAKAKDPDGVYLKHDLRKLSELGQHDGVWACACLYHLTKEEFQTCLKAIWNSLNPGGVFFCNLKIGEGEQYIEQPRKGYPGGEEAQVKLMGNRFYAFYEVEELEDYFLNFDVLKKRKDILKEGKGAMEFWLRKL
jgi:SAM-dependent methyltransferase